jgi:hypothetical protein
MLRCPCPDHQALYAERRRRSIFPWVRRAQRTLDLVEKARDSLRKCAEAADAIEAIAERMRRTLEGDGYRTSWSREDLDRSTYTAAEDLGSSDE